MDGPRYPVELGWHMLFRDLGISEQDVLRHADLPLDLFVRESATVSGPEYFRIWDGLATVQQDLPTFPLELALRVTPDTFNPILFACYCSRNLRVAAVRIGRYKPLLCPMRIGLVESEDRATITIDALPGDRELPASMVAAELAWWVHMPRLATREQLVPVAVNSRVDLTPREAYEEFFGTAVTRSDFNGVTFSTEDIDRPFLTAGDSIWEFFEPHLNQRMKDLSQSASYAEKVRACLMEILASGQHAVDDVASRLAVSSRTLQRRLRDEGTSFQSVLDGLRERLAQHYLSDSEYTASEISFLLGYDDPGSFMRAFRGWTGSSPATVRAGG